MTRQVQAIIVYNKKDISAEITPYLKSVSYTDNMSGQADDLQITLEDRQGLWQSAWMPEKGASLTVTLLAKDWAVEGMPDMLQLGTFEIDEVASSGPPSEVQIKATSIPYSNTLRGEEHTRSWEKAELKTIAKDIADGAKLELLYDTQDNPTLDRAEQTEESDLAFLLNLCGDHGLALKVSDGKLIIFDEAAYEQAEPVYYIVKGESALLTYSLSTKLRDVYAACHVSYQAGKDKQLIEATFTAPERTGKTLQVHEQVASIAEAERLAKKRLRDKNKDEVTGNISVMGDFNLVAGIAVQLIGFGAYDGRYIITSAGHDIGGSYTTNISIRRCLDGY